MVVMLHFGDSPGQKCSITHEGYLPQVLRVGKSTAKIRACNKMALERGTIPERMVPVPFCSATIAAMVPSAKLGQSPAILLHALSQTAHFRSPAGPSNFTPIHAAATPIQFHYGLTAFSTGCDGLART